VTLQAIRCMISMRFVPSSLMLLFFLDSLSPRLFLGIFDRRGHYQQDSPDLLWTFFLVPGVASTRLFSPSASPVKVCRVRSPPLFPTLHSIQAWLASPSDVYVLNSCCDTSVILSFCHLSLFLPLSIVLETRTVYIFSLPVCGAFFTLLGFESVGVREEGRFSSTPR